MKKTVFLTFIIIVILFCLTLLAVSLAFLARDHRAALPPDTDTAESADGVLANIITRSPNEEALLASMSLEEKAAQLIMASCHEAGSAQEAARLSVGGLCLYADAFQDKTPDQVRQMTESLQAASDIPLLISVDEEGGSVCRVSTNAALRAEPFQSPLALYQAGGFALIESDSAEKSALLLDLGINVNLAPVCDVPLSASDYIYVRSFGTDADLTADYVSRIVAVMKASGIGCTLKHFPGYGGSSDTHKGMAYDSRPYEDFLSRDFLPFQAGIAAGADSVLVSHNIVQCMDESLPASLSPEVHRILREELGFDGVIISDDLFMDAIVQFTGGENAAVQAVLAGNDLICCADVEASIAAITDAVERGVIPLEQIDASILRIFRWKTSLGLDISEK